MEEAGWRNRQLELTNRSDRRHSFPSRDLPYAFGAGKRLQRFHTRQAELLGSDLTAIAGLIACKKSLFCKGGGRNRAHSTLHVQTDTCALMHAQYNKCRNLSL